MSLYTGCTGAASLTATPTFDCAVSLAQVQRLIFQRRTDSGTRNSITIATSNPNLEATWTALEAAGDNTTVVYTPIFGAPTTEGGEPIEFGSGNEVPGGQPIRLQSGTTQFSATFYAIPQKVIKALKALAGEDLQVYFIDAEGRIIGETDDPDSPTVFQGFPIDGLFFSDKSLGGYDAPDSNTLRFNLPANWSDNEHIVTPSDFDALNDLV